MTLIVYGEGRGVSGSYNLLGNVCVAGGKELNKVLLFYVACV